MTRTTIAQLEEQAEQISKITGTPHTIQNHGAGWMLCTRNGNVSSAMKTGELLSWMLAYKLGLVHGKMITRGKY